MATINFYLKDPNSTNETLVYLYFRFKGYQIKYSAAQNIKPAFWNAKSMRARQTMEDADDFNSELDRIEEAAKKTLKAFRFGGGKLSMELVKEKLIQVLDGKDEVETSLLQFAEDYLQSSISIKRAGTLKTQRHSLEVLKDFKKVYTKRIDFDTINLDFYNDFVDYLLRVKKYGTNTAGKHINNLKLFLNEATERGLNKKLDYKSSKFKAMHEETDAIYLNEDEIKRIYELPLGHNPKLERVRDLFIVGCWSGMRFSDFSQIKPENIVNQKIIIRTQKTGEVVAVPQHEYFKAIWEKYGGDLPPAISNQKMNEYLKDVGELAKLNSAVEISKTKGGVLVKTKCLKYQLLSTHTARRSFCTNLYLAGFPAISIMKMSGHRTESSFLKYLKISPEQHAELLDRFWKRNNIQSGNEKSVTKPKQRKSKKKRRVNN